MWIFGLLTLGALLNEDRLIEEKKQRSYELGKSDWRTNKCSKGQHFVGSCVYEGCVECEICHARPEWVSKKVDKYGTPLKWKWKVKKEVNEKN